METNDHSRAVSSDKPVLLKGINIKVELKASAEIKEMINHLDLDWMLELPQFGSAGKRIHFCLQETWSSI